MKETGAGAMAGKTGCDARDRERSLGLLASLAAKLAQQHELEDALLHSLEAAMRLGHSSAGALALVDQARGEMLRCIERKFPKDFLTGHILPNLLRSFEESPATARAPTFFSCSHTGLPEAAASPAAPFRVTTIPLVWNGELRGVLVTAGPSDQAEDPLLLEVFQSFVSCALGTLDRLSVILRAKNQWEKTFDSLQDVVFITDADGRIIRANLSAASSIGWDIRDLVGSSCSDTFRDKFCPGEACLLSKAAEKEGSVVSDHNVGERDWYRLRVYPILDPDRSLLGGLHWITDLSEFRQARGASGEEGTLAAETQRAASLERLVDSLAHDLKNPLTYLMMTASRLEMGRPELEEPRLLVEQASRMRAILDNIVEKSRTGAPQALHPLDLNEILRRELSHLESDPFYVPQIRRVVRFAPDLPTIRGVHADFSASFANILLNSLHAMWNRENPTLTVSTYADSEAISVEIADSGTGIPEDNLCRIFEPFFTTKTEPDASTCEVPAGTGLGLASVERLLRPYGATFDVESKEGEGTRFRIRIPLSLQRP